MTQAERDIEGQRQIQELFSNINDPVFNEWERQFIRNSLAKKYAMLTKHEKVVVNRLMGWFRGK